MVTPPLNVAVIGYGLSAKVFHIPFISSVPELNLYAIVQRQPARHNDAGKEHPGVRIYRSTSELVRDAEVDLVVVATASHTHFDLCKLALEADKHGSSFLSCWKPLVVC